MFFCEFPVNPHSPTHASSRVPETHILPTIRMPKIRTPPPSSHLTSICKHNGPSAEGPKQCTNAQNALVLERVNRCRNTAATGHEGLAAGLVDRHDGCVTHEAAEVRHLADTLARHGDHAHGGGLLIDHADGGFVGDQAGDGGSSGIARNGNHVEADGAHAGHGLKLFDLQAAIGCRVDHVLVFGDRDERAGQAAHVGGRHNAALLHLVVEHGERRCGAGSADLFEADLLKHFADGVAYGRGRREGKVDDAEWNAKATGCLLCHQLADARDLERGALDGFAQELEVLALGRIQCAGDDTRTGNAHVDHGVAFGDAVEAAGHERVVVRHVAEGHELDAAVGVVVGGALGNVLDDVAEQFDRVHVDAGLGGTDVHGRADDVGLGKGLRQGADEQLLGRGHGLGDECGVAADQVDADFLGCLVKRVGDLDEVLARLAGAGTDQRDRGDGDALVDDRDAVVAFDGLAGGNEVLGIGSDLAVDVVAGLVDIVRGAVEQRDAHGDGADVELLLLDHLIGLVDLHDVQHGLFLTGYLKTSLAVTLIRGIRMAPSAESPPGFPPPRVRRPAERVASNTVHLGEDFLTLAADAHADVVAEVLKVADHRAEVLVRVGVVDNHHHVEVTVDDGLGNVKHVDLMFGKVCADACDDADSILTDDGDDCLVHGTPWSYTKSG